MISHDLLAADPPAAAVSLPKAPTGVMGLDQITRGGLPMGRTTLLCGGPGCGKTVLAMEFLARGARDRLEPGLFVSFEETTGQLIANFRSLGFGVEELIQKKLLKVSYIELATSGVVETNGFSLDALRIRLEHSIDQMGAKQVVLDSIETLYSALSSSDVLRHEVARLLRWLAAKGVTAIVTGERGAESLTRHGFEDYISDCVILLDQRVTEQTSKRRLRIVKYRGSAHAMDEFPFFIGDQGFSVLPITSLNLDYGVSPDRVSTGVGGLDAMMEGRGLYRSSAGLISGRSGTGKSSLAAAFAVAACERGERCLYFSLEESPAQITRNMKSLGIDFDRWVKKGLLTLRSFRPTLTGLEEHLVAVGKDTEAVNPSCVVLDPITNFVRMGDFDQVQSMLARLLDLFKNRGITLLMTALATGDVRLDETRVNISALVDTWIAVDVERIGHLGRRVLYIIKSRGMEHSHQTCELRMSRQGLSIGEITAEAPL